MPRAIWLRIGLVAVVVVGSILFLYPPKQKINLGLDLQGGTHLVFGVDAARAVANQTGRVAESLKAALEQKGIGTSRVAPDGDASIVVELASPRNYNDAVTVAREFGSYELRDENSAAGRFRLVLNPREIDRLRDLAVSQAVETIRNRVDQFGVAEPTITRQGDDRILIQLPGVQDPERAKALIGKTALLEFKLLDERTPIDEALAGRLPETSEVLYQHSCGREKRDARADVKRPVVVQKRTLLTGAELNDARVASDPNSAGNWQVAIEFNGTGAKIFAEVTEQNVGKHLAIVLDGTVCSWPRINERIPGGRAVITGQFSADDARDLVIVLRAGALPAPVKILEERTVGPSLGADSIRQGLIAISASAAVVFVFMLFYYRLSGLIADVALGLNLLILFACMAAFGATLTLPGLAGIALTVGMAVDTNILIFERIREELRVGKTPRSAIEAGFNRALRTIIDTHLTVMGTAVILWGFGSGTVKGFGVTLFVGLLASLFTAYFFTRLLFDLVFVRRQKLQTVSI